MSDGERTAVAARPLLKPFPESAHNCLPVEPRPSLFQFLWRHRAWGLGEQRHELAEDLAPSPLLDELGEPVEPLPVIDAVEHDGSTSAEQALDDRQFEPIGSAQPRHERGRHDDLSTNRDTTAVELYVHPHDSSHGATATRIARAGRSVMRPMGRGA